MPEYWYDIDQFTWDEEEKVLLGEEESFNNYGSEVPFPNKGRQFYVKNNKTNNFRRFRLLREFEDRWVFESEDNIKCIVKKIIDMMDVELKKLVERLQRIFPNVTINYEGEIFNGSGDYEDFAPPREIDWFEVIERLRKDGLEIANRKESKRTNCHCGKPIDFSNPDCAAFSLCKDCATDC